MDPKPQKFGGIYSGSTEVSARSGLSLGKAVPRSWFSEADTEQELSVSAIRFLTAAASGEYPFSIFHFIINMPIVSPWRRAASLDADDKQAPCSWIFMCHCAPQKKDIYGYGWWETLLGPQLSLAPEEGPSSPTPGQGMLGMGAAEPAPSLGPSCRGPGRGVCEGSCAVPPCLVGSGFPARWEQQQERSRWAGFAAL